MDDDVCVEFAETMLGGPAKTFWENCLETADTRRDPPYTWTEMREILRRKYVPRLYATQVIMDWLDCKQGKRTVSEYIEEFEDYRLRCKKVDDQQMLIAMFARGLNDEPCAEILTQSQLLSMRHII